MSTNNPFVTGPDEFHISFECYFCIGNGEARARLITQAVPSVLCSFCMFGVLYSSQPLLCHHDAFLFTVPSYSEPTPVL